jgi:hypothetical protein
MNTLRFVATGAALLIVSGCADGRDASAPTAPSSAVKDRSAEHSASSSRRVQTSGKFDAHVFFPTVTLTPKGRNCLLQVDGELVFTGTIEGTAPAHTSALEAASCAEVAANPPGTFPDVFTSVAVFDGFVDGKKAHANLLYAGRVQVGGHIDAVFILSDGVAGILAVDAQVAVGGTYRGAVVVR